MGKGMHPNSLAALDAGRVKWKKGQSGNPKGGSKLSRQLRKVAKVHCPEALDVCLDLMRNAENERVRLAAASEILNRGMGKPTAHQSKEVKHRVGSSYIEALKEINSRPKIKMIDGEMVEIGPDGNEIKPDCSQPAPKSGNAEGEPDQ